MSNLFSAIRAVFSGRKTHILVLLSIVAATFNSVVNEGGDLGDINMWVDNAKLGMISTFKMMFDRR